MTFEEKIRAILEHIGNERDNGIKLGFKIIDHGDRETGLKLIANCLCHDWSKLGNAFEFEHLWKDDEQFEAALNMHRMRNKHHPEYWGGMKNMPKEYVAEMVADCAARSQEQLDKPFREWAHDQLTQKYGLTKNTKAYRLFMKYLEMLLEPPFEAVKTSG